MACWNNFIDWLGLDVFCHDDASGADSVMISHDPLDNHVCLINPATNLPMLDGHGCGGVDVGGSPFGMDIHHHEETFSSSGFDTTNDWSSSSDWIDPFSS
jgi:hypothetical protein